MLYCMLRGGYEVCCVAGARPLSVAKRGGVLSCCGHPVAYPEPGESLGAWPMGRCITSATRIPAQAVSE